MRRASVASVAAVALVACSSGASNDPGLRATLRVEGATFVEGAPPAADPAGPAVGSVTLVTSAVYPGEAHKALGATLAGTSTAAVVALEGDVGYWIVPAGVPDVATPGLASLHATMSFAPWLAGGAATLAVRAVDAAGRAGAPSLVALAVTGAVPAGRLVVTLGWDTESDLDLHLVVPGGAEVYKGNVNSYAPPPPGSPPDPPDAWKGGGVLDFDSNASCVVDGRRRENVVWGGPPPSGHYVARVDTFSLCGAPGAYWTLAVLLDGRVVAQARGQSTAFDEEQAHDRGAGVLALEFDVP